MTTLQEIKDKLNDDAASALSWLMPNGVLIRNEFCCGDVTGKAPRKGNLGSFKFNCKRLTGKDWAGGERGFYGVYDVFVAHFDGNQTKAIEASRSFLKMPAHERPQPAQGHEPGRRKRRDDKIEVIEVITPAPETRPLIPQHHRHVVKGLWPWRTKEGELVGYTYRIEFTDKASGARKKFPLPLTWCKLRHTDTKKEWSGWHNAGLPFPQPLSDAHQLSRCQRLLLVEGEKTRDAALEIIQAPDGPLSGFDKCITWYGGVERIAYIDWSPLGEGEPKEIYGWPDADAVSSQTLHRPGFLAMERVGAELAKLPVRPTYFITDPQKTWKLISDTPLPSGWDLADPIPSPGTDAWIKETILKAEQYL